MSNPDTKKYSLRLPVKLRNALQEIADHKRNSLGPEIVYRISYISGLDWWPDIPEEISGDEYEYITMNIPVDLHTMLKKAADAKRHPSTGKPFTINDEILRRIYCSDPLKNLQVIRGEAVQNQAADNPPNYETRKPLTIDEITILGKLFFSEWDHLYYREGSDVQRAVMTQIKGAAIAHTLVSDQFKDDIEHLKLRKKSPKSDNEKSSRG